MTGTDGFEHITVRQSGVTVEKTLDREGYGVPAVTFRVTARTDGPVSVTLRERLPEAVDAGRVGFDPEHGGEHWERDGGGDLLWSRTLEPGETCETLYGVATADEAALDALLTVPTIEAVEPVDDRADDGTVEPIEVPAGSADGGEDDDATAGGPPESTGRRRNGDGAAGAAADRVSGDREPDERGPDDRESPVQPPDARSGGGAGEVPQLRAKVDYLNKRVGKLEAYTDALESFIADVEEKDRPWHDTAEAGDVAGRVEALADELEGVRDAQAALGERLDAMEDRYATLEYVQQRLARLEADVTGKADAEQVAALSRSLEALRSEGVDAGAAVADPEALAALREQVAANTAWREGVAAAADANGTSGATAANGAQEDAAPDGESTGEDGDRTGVDGNRTGVNGDRTGVDDGPEGTTNGDAQV